MEVKKTVKIFHESSWIQRKTPNSQSQWGRFHWRRRDIFESPLQLRRDNSFIKSLLVCIGHSPFDKSDTAWTFGTIETFLRVKVKASKESAEWNKVNPKGGKWKCSIYILHFDSRPNKNKKTDQKQVFKHSSIFIGRWKFSSRNLQNDLTEAFTNQDLSYRSEAASSGVVWKKVTFS